MPLDLTSASNFLKLALNGASFAVCSDPMKIGVDYVCAPLCEDERKQRGE